MKISRAAARSSPRAIFSDASSLGACRCLHLSASLVSSALNECARAHTRLLFLRWSSLLPTLNLSLLCSICTCFIIVVVIIVASSSPGVFLVGSLASGFLSQPNATAQMMMRMLRKMRGTGARGQLCCVSRSLTPLFGPL